MAAGKLNRYWTLLIILLVAAIVIGGIVAWCRYSPSQPVEISIPQVGEEQERQKIDINRAEVRQLKTLPGIGDILAQRIVDYRQENGPFHDTSELTEVAGIGTGRYEQIKDLITVAD